MAQLDHALTTAMADLQGIDYALNHREILNAVFSYRTNGAILDMGGSGNIYHQILKRLGMDVEIIDFDFNETLKPRLSDLGIKFTNGNLFSCDIGTDKYDIVSSFECFEHFPHGPQVVMNKAYAALKPGGSFVMSVPNVVRFEQRWRVLIGETPFEKYESWYRATEFFIGHHREMTTAEVRYIFSQCPLQLEELFTTDMTVQTRKQRTWLKKLTSSINYKYLLTDRIMPQNFRKHIWAKATKQ